MTSSQSKAGIKARCPVSCDACPKGLTTPTSSTTTTTIVTQTSYVATLNPPQYRFNLLEGLLDATSWESRALAVGQKHGFHPISETSLSSDTSLAGTGTLLSVHVC